MAERRSQRLKVVLMLAERKEQAAAAQLAESRKALEREEEQLEQLEDYRQQYLEEYRQLARGVDAQALMSYSGFLQRLGGALSGQQQKLSQAHQVLELRRSEWQQHYHQRRSLEEMINRMEREEDATQEQRQQREIDDLAAQRVSSSGDRRKP